MATNGRPTLVLSLDGGGIRGIIPAVVLQQLEDRIGKPAGDIFDLMLGTSTGGILAGALSMRAEDGSARYTAADMVKLYSQRGRDIFSRSLWRSISSVGGATEPQYSVESLEGLLKDYMGDADLKAAHPPVVLTSYDIERREPYFFKTASAKARDNDNYLLRDAVRATSAAPTYFKPARFKSLSSIGAERALVDGGVYVNNPAVLGYSEAVRDLGADPGNLVIVSIGTGVATRPIPYEEAADWGAVGWIQPLISVMMDGQSKAADDTLTQLLPGSHTGEGQRYFRFDTRLDLALDDMDAAGAGNIQNLKDEASQILDDQRYELDRLIGLIKPDGSRNRDNAAES